MNNKSRKKVEVFLGNFEEALGRSGRHSTSIVGEVRADLEAHVEGQLSEGKSDEEAVDHALGQMGNPYELAHQIRREITPSEDRVLTWIRYAAASGVIVWTLIVLWNFRAGTYGFGGPRVSGIVILIHLPFILLLWPGIVWRKNWLFGLLPAGLGLLLFVFMIGAGVEKEGVALSIPEAGSEIATSREDTLELQVDPAEPRSGMASRVAILGGFGIVAIILLLAIQQRFQRRVIVLCLMLAVAIIEAPFQVEEHFFRRDREQVRDYFETSLRENGVHPTQAMLRSSGPNLTNKHALLHVDDADYSIFWNRPLCSGYAINYSSKDERLWVQD